MFLVDPTKAYVTSFDLCKSIANTEKRQRIDELE
jgi:hypothetical protein